MRRLRLRTQLVIASLFLGAYSVAIAASYRVQGRAQEQLERSFREDLATLTKLPRLGDLLRHQALLTQQFLLTGQPQFLEERRRALEESRRLRGDLIPLLSGEREKRISGRLERELGAYLAEQEQWIERRRQGRLSLGGAVQVVSRSGSIESLVMLLLEMRDANIAALQRRREAARLASRLAFHLTLGTGLVVGGVLVAFLSWYIIGPLTSLEGYASRWRLGQEWALSPAASGPEIESLFRCLREMSQRLNEEYSKERDLARFKSQLVSMVSHEFNNALSIINGASTLLEDTEGQTVSKRRSYYEMLNANLRALHIASNNLLNMGRLESGRFSISPRKTDLPELVRQAAQRLEILSLRKKQTVRVEMPSPPPAVLADPEALSLVLTNLLTNAIKYTPENGRVIVRMEQDPADPRRALLSVRDSGIGIDPGEHERVFTGFYRTEQGKSAAKGFGVGLSLAKRIVEAHDSALQLDSKLGEGAVFSFSLPLWDEAAQTEEVS